MRASMIESLTRRSHGFIRYYSLNGIHQWLLNLFKGYQIFIDY